MSENVKTVTKQIDPAALASLTTGYTLVEFAEMADAAEFIMGHPIFTHQYLVLHKQIIEAVHRQFPEMPTEILPEGWEATRDAINAKYGQTVTVTQGSGETEIHPADPAGFPEALRDKPKVAVVVPDKE